MQTLLARQLRPVRSSLARIIAVLVILAGTPCWAETTVLVPQGSTWKYLDNGTSPALTWRNTVYDEAGWKSGPAQLGYGDGDEATVIGFGSNPALRAITAYFRRTFQVTNPATLGSLQLRLLRDDGAIVYLNGTEIFRSNIPTGPVAASTAAASVATGGGETSFYPIAVSSTLLVAGANTLAVELHQSDAASIDASFDLSLTADTGPAVNRGPYLQLPSQDSMTVQWRTTKATDTVVRYGTDPAYLLQVASSGVKTTEHEIRISGLSPDTRYFYAVGTALGNLSGPASDQYFVTSPLAGASRATRVWVLGDSGMANADVRAVRDAYLGFTGSRGTDLMLMLGDNAYESGLDTEYQRAVFDMFPSVLRSTPLFATLGNHDTGLSIPTAQTGPYFTGFALPAHGEAGGLASGTEAYYSFDYANIHFISLNSSGSTDRSAAGPMMTWLQSDLSITQQPWIIAFWHHPPYSKGSHDSDVDSHDADMRNIAVPLLEQYGVDLVLSGHSHSYERSFLLDGHYGWSSSFVPGMKKNGGSGNELIDGAYTKPGMPKAPHSGAVYAVAGNASQLQGGSLNHPAMYTALNVLGSMVVDINGKRLDARFVDSTGAVRDRFTILKDAAGGVPVPARPSGLAATAASSTTVSLSWVDNSTNETGFSIERSIGNASEFAQIATVAAGVSQYSNAGLVAGRTYYYRVRAFNSAGSSRFTDPAFVTLPGGGASAGPLVPLGSIWRFLDNGSNQGTAWRATAFNDSAWPAAAAQLGYGDGDEATVVNKGPTGKAHYVTTYFRRSFSIQNPAATAALKLNLLRDDGAVVYLNGTEVFRSNMPAGSTGYTTLASSGIAGSSETKYVSANLSASLLVAGTNVIAVEIHQDDPWSSDLSFDLELVAQ